MKRLLSSFGVALALAGVTTLAVFAVPDFPKLGNSQPVFNPVVRVCFGDANPNPVTVPLPLCVGGGADFSLGGVPTNNSAIQLLKGNRGTLPNAYAGPGFRVTRDGSGPVNGTQIGGVRAQIDLLCDGVVDLFSDSSGTPPAVVSEQIWKVTTAWGAGTETVFGTTPAYPNTDGSYLDKTTPPVTVATRVNRGRADVTTIWTGTNGSAAPAGTISLAPGTPLNTILLHPVWSPGGTAASGTTASTMSGTTLLLTQLGGAANVPSNQLLCLQAPQNSETYYTGIGATGIVGNPVACAGPITDNCGAGLYVRWTVFLSAADIVNNAQTARVIQQCDDFPAGAYTDTDADCLQGSAAPIAGRPTESLADDAGTALGSCPAGNVIPLASATTADRDCDGLRDGIEVAWGSSPILADTDSDTRTDLEEMLGPGTSLTDPTDPDTDNDNATCTLGTGATTTPCTAAANDGGLHVVALSGVYTVDSLDADDYRLTVQIPADTVLSLQSVYSGDNCPNIANGAALGPSDQTNGSDDRLGYATGDPGTDWPGQAALPATRPDRTNPQSGLTGDACTNDIDGDSVNDLAEELALQSTTAGNACITTSGSPVAAPLGNPTNPASGVPSGVSNRVSDGGTFADTDGDRVRDGRECQRGTAPRNNGYATDASPAPAGQIACSGTCAPTSPVGTNLTYSPGALPPTVDWASFARVIGIATDTGSYIGTGGCGSAQICSPTNFGLLINPCSGGGSCGPDSDGDILFDAVEVYCHGTNPANVDTDRDGLSDTVEIISTDTNVGIASSDLLYLAFVYLQTGARSGGPYAGNNPDTLWEPNVDYNCNGQVDSTDLLMLAAAYQLNVPDSVNPSGRLPLRLATP